MKIGVDTYSLHLNLGVHEMRPANPMSLEQMMDWLSHMNVDGIHLDPLHFDSNKDLERVRTAAQKNRWYVELGAMEIERLHLRKALYAADAMDARVLRTFLGGSCNDSRALIEQRVKKAKRVLQEICPLAQRLGIKVAVENHIDCFIDDLLELLDIDSAFIGLCFDSGNFVATGEDPLSAADLFSEKIFCTHIKDVRKSCVKDAPCYGLAQNPVQFCALGDGMLPIRALIERLCAKKGNDTRITLEIATPYRMSMPQEQLLCLEKKNVQKSIEYLRDLSPS